MIKLWTLKEGHWSVGFIKCRLVSRAIQKDGQEEEKVLKRRRERGLENVWYVEVGSTSNKGVNRKEASVSQWVMGFLLIKKLEEDLIESYRHSSVRASAKGTAREAGFRVLAEREFKLAFSLAEILGINKKFSLHIQNHLS